MKKGRYLITGCAGFIGSNLVNKIYKKISKKDFYPFYPKMLLDTNTGEDIRIIAQHSKIS